MFYSVCYTSIICASNILWNSINFLYMTYMHYSTIFWKATFPFWCPEHKFQVEHQSGCRNARSPNAWDNNLFCINVKLKFGIILHWSKKKLDKHLVITPTKQLNQRFMWIHWGSTSVFLINTQCYFLLSLSLAPPHWSLSSHDTSTLFWPGTSSAKEAKWFHQKSPAICLKIVNL